jgi:hypothetical protein
MERFARFKDVRTRSLTTAAVLVLLGHEQIGVINEGNEVDPTVRFQASAQEDLRRYIAAKDKVVKYLRAQARK